MDLGQMIVNDHVNITELYRDTLRAIGQGGARSRDRLVAQLDGEIRSHFEAVEESLYEALEGEGRTRRLVEELSAEQKEIKRQLKALARSGNKDGRDWTMRFEDLTYLIDQYLHREARELLPAARELLHPDEMRQVREEFVEEKLEALRDGRGRRGWGVSPRALVLGGLAGVAAIALAAAWRDGGFDRARAARAVRRLRPW